MSKGRVLVVEDDLVTRNLLELAVTNLGYECVSCPDGHEAWHRFRANPFPIVVSDWDMPELDGLSLCKRIREEALDTYAYFIMVTAKTGLHDYEEAMDAGVDDFLTKPLDKSKLAIRMRVANRIIGFERSVRQLQAILPLCTHCNKVRSDENYWEKVETYLEENTENLVSHSICPDCFEKHFKD